MVSSQPLVLYYMYLSSAMLPHLLDLLHQIIRGPHYVGKYADEFSNKYQGNVWVEMEYNPDGKKICRCIPSVSDNFSTILNESVEPLLYLCLAECDYF